MNRPILTARTDDGTALPIIDVTHPAFAISLDAAEHAHLLEQFVREQQPLEKMPRLLRSLMMRFLLRKSVIARALRGAEGTFLSGMGTYLLKLGPDQLDAVSRAPIDRKIASALPALSVRLRLQDIAELLAGALAPKLAAAPGRALHLVNVAGGPALDSVNALILLRRLAPAVLEHRAIALDVLDLDVVGSAFGARALEALRSDEGPLRGLEVAHRHVRYDWSRPQELAAHLRGLDGVVAVSSEGGLFEYGSDEEIVGNLAAIAEAAPAGTIVAGSVTRADPTAMLLHRSWTAAVRPRGLAAFEALADRAGWKVARALERAFSDQVLLERR